MLPYLFTRKSPLECRSAFRRSQEVSHGRRSDPAALPAGTATTEDGGGESDTRAARAEGTELWGIRRRGGPVTGRRSTGGRGRGPAARQGWLSPLSPGGLAEPERTSGRLEGVGSGWYGRGALYTALDLIDQPGTDMRVRGHQVLILTCAAALLGATAACGGAGTATKRPGTARTAPSHARFDAEISLPDGRRVGMYYATGRGLVEQHRGTGSAAWSTPHLLHRTTSDPCQSLRLKAFGTTVAAIANWGCTAPTVNHRRSPSPRSVPETSRSGTPMSPRLRRLGCREGLGRDGRAEFHQWLRRVGHEAALAPDGGVLRRGGDPR